MNSSEQQELISVADVAARSSVAFGTSGARGLVVDMTDEVCFTYTAGFLKYLMDIGQFAPGMPVALAGDLRPSTPRILSACAAAVEHLGGQVAFCGYVPSPALGLYGLVHAIPSLMVTGSHIPDDRNGIKFNRADGELLKEDESGVLGQSVVVPAGQFDAEGSQVHPVALGEPIDVLTSYVARYRDFFGPTALQGLRVGVYEHSAVGRDVLGDILRALGAETVSLGRTEVFTPVDTEAIREEDIVLARQWAESQSFDAIVSTDGDSDRPLLSDEHGVWLRGDILGILTAQSLGAEVVVTPVSSNTALEKSGLFTQVRRTRIGSPYVISAMMAALAEGAGGVCGFEANGGFLLASELSRADVSLRALPTRDAVLPIVAVLAQANAQKSPVSALVSALPERYTHSDRLKAFPTELTRSRLAAFQTGDSSAVAEFSEMFGSVVGAAAKTIDLTDGVRATFANADVIHLRPSGNAPELRCYTEADSMARAKALCADAMAVLETWRETETS